MLKFCTLQLARTENLRNTEQHRGNTIPTTSDLELAKPLVLSDIDYQIIDYRLSIIDCKSIIDWPNIDFPTSGIHLLSEPSNVVVVVPTQGYPCPCPFAFSSSSWP
jgi:hypothetical protein